MTTATIIIIAVAAVFAAVVLGLSLYAYFAVRFYFLRRKEKAPRAGNESPFRRYRRENTEELRALPFERIEMTSSDGLTLRARYYAAPDPKGTVLALHGYRGECTGDIAFAVLLLIRNGYSVLAPDLRAHGESEGRTVGFGVTDRFDALDWLRLAEKRDFPRPMWIFGLSMGAATALMTADLPLPGSVRGIIADCPYTSIDDQLRHLYAHKAHVPPPIIMPFIRLFVRLLAGYRTRAVSASKTVRRSPVPILLIHGRNDDFVPPEMTEQIAAACASPCRVLRTDGRHASSHFTAPEIYSRTLTDFLSRTR